MRPSADIKEGKFVVWLSSKDEQRLRAFCKKRKSRPSFIIRLAVMKYLEEERYYPINDLVERIQRLQTAFRNAKPK